MKMIDEETVAPLEFFLFWGSGGRGGGGGGGGGGGEGENRLSC